MHNDQPASPQQSFLPPLQLKGEIMDLEFTIDTDHRCALCLPLSCPSKKIKPGLQQTPAEQDYPELSELSYVQAEGMVSSSSCKSARLTLFKCDRKRPCQRCIQLGLVGALRARYNTDI